MARVLDTAACITRTREELILLAHCFAASIDPAFFNAHKYSKDVIGVSVTGSMDAFKSGFIDFAAEAALKGKSKNDFLSGLGKRGKELRVRRGKSFLYDRKDVTLSYSDGEPQRVWERYDEPGIHFDQNALPKDTIHSWLGIELRAPKPEKPEDLAGIYREEEDVSEDLTRMFAYAEEKLLRKTGLLKSFKKAVEAEAEMPRMLVFNIFDDRLITNPKFQTFMNVIGDIKKHPDRSSEIIADAYHEIVGQAMPPLSLQKLAESMEARRNEMADDAAVQELHNLAIEGKIDHARTLEELTEDEIACLDEEGQLEVRDTIAWLQYMRDQNPNDPRF